ncbi:hexulose-6-phosphate isomerase, partial [Gardnerella vaginalis]
MQQTEYIDTICNTTYNFINTKNTLLTGGEMSQWDKLLKRILSLSKDMRF